MLLWAVSEANKHQRGGGYNLIEFLNDVAAGYKAWNDYKNLMVLKVKKCPQSGPLSYGEQMKKYIMETYKGGLVKFGYDTVSKAQSLLSDLDDLQITKEFLDGMEDCMDVSHPFLNDDKSMAIIINNMRY